MASMTMPKPDADVAPTAAPESATAAEDTESNPVLPGLTFQNLHAACAATTSPNNAQVGDASPPESDASVSSSKSDDYNVSEASISKSERPLRLMTALRLLPRAKYLFQSVDGGSQGYTGRGTPRHRIAVPLEDHLGPGCTHAKGQNCSVHYKHRSAKQSLQLQADDLTARLQMVFRQHDRERVAHERNFQFLCKRRGPVAAQAMLDEHKTKLRTLATMLHSVRAGRGAVDLQDDDMWVDEEDE